MHRCDTICTHKTKKSLPEIQFFLAFFPELIDKTDIHAVLFSSQHLKTTFGLTPFAKKMMNVPVTQTNHSTPSIWDFSWVIAGRKWKCKHSSKCQNDNETLKFRWFSAAQFLFCAFVLQGANWNEKWWNSLKQIEPNAAAMMLMHQLVKQWTKEKLVCFLIVQILGWFQKMKLHEFLSTDQQDHSGSLNVQGVWGSLSMSRQHQSPKAVAAVATNLWVFFALSAVSC